MADIIGEIISEQAFQDTARLGKELDALIDKFSKTAGGAIALEKALRQSSNDAPEKIQAYNKELSETEKIQKAVMVASAKFQVSKTEENRILQETRLETNKTNAAIRAQKKVLDSTKHSIERADLLIAKWGAQQKKLNLFTKEGIRQSELYSKAIARQNKFRKENANVVEKQRLNVGNYKDGNIELLQVLREFPSLANSVQTFMMAISNNLPQLIQRVKITAVEMGSWRKGLAKVASGLFSFGGIVALVTTALTFLVPIVAKAAGEMKLFKRESDQAADSQKHLNEAWKDESVKSAISNIEELKAQILLAKDGMVKKEQVVKLYNTTIGKTVGLVKNLDGVEQSLAKNADAYIKMTVLKAAANLALEEASKKALEAERTRAQTETSLVSDMEGLYKFLSAGSIAKIAAGIYDAEVLKEITAARELQHRLNIKGLQNEADKEISLYQHLQKKVGKVAKEFGFNLFGDNKEGRKTPKKDEKEQPFKAADFSGFGKFWTNYQEEHSEKVFEIYAENEKAMQNETDMVLRELDKRYAQGGIRTELYEKKRTEIQLKHTLENSKNQLQLAQDLIQDTALLGEDRVKITDYIEKLKTKITATQAKIRKGIQKEEDEETAALAKKRKKELEDYKKELENISSLSQSLLSNTSDFGEIAFQKQMQRIGAEKQAMEERYDLEAAKIKANFTTIEDRDRALGQLELKRALERDRIQKEELKVKQRAARFQRSVDIASIISSTAIAVMSALGAKPYTPANIALATSAGAAGAVQLAKAIATPIPQYAEGVKSKPVTGWAEVGEKGQEIIKEPGKKPYLTPNSSSFMHLPKGTEVIPNHKLMEYVYSSPTIPKWNSTGTNSVSIDYGELRGDIQDLSQVLKRKKMSVNIRNDYFSGSYKQRNIR